MLGRRASPQARAGIRNSHRGGTPVRRSMTDPHADAAHGPQTPRQILTADLTPTRDIPIVNASAPAHPTGRWLLIIVHLPQATGSARVQVWRRFTRQGAVLAHNGVWLLPYTPERLIDARALARDVTAANGHCSVCAASLLEGLGDDEIESLFRDARTADCDAIVADAATFKQKLRAKRRAVTAVQQRRTLATLERRLAELRAITFVATPALRLAELAVVEIRALVHGLVITNDSPDDAIRARTWVTRRGVFVDRITSAWLIRRFIDPSAIFRFVDPSTHVAQAGELRFDMSPGEYGHEDDRCTFETLCVRFGLHEAGHRAIGEMVHDLDCRESRYQRPETAGFLRMLDGVASETVDDLERIERAVPLLDILFRGFAVTSHRRSPTPRAHS